MGYRWYAVVLAAGFGERLRRDIDATGTQMFDALRDVPKALLPVGGRTILDRWLDAFEEAGVVSTVVVTNQRHAEAFGRALRDRKGRGNVRLISDGSDRASARMGANYAMLCGLECLQLGAVYGGDCEQVIVCAGDTLLVDTTLRELIGQAERQWENVDAAVTGYELQDMTEACRRGMLQVEGEDGDEYVLGLVEKPRTRANAPSNVASLPIYFFKSEYATVNLRRFLKDRRGGPVESVDAPGLFIAYIASRTARLRPSDPRRRRYDSIKLVRASSRIDVGGLEQYRRALQHFQAGKDFGGPLIGEPVVGRALPRVGLLGNPSDGYGGKVVGFLTEGCGYAEVTSRWCDEGWKGLRFEPSPVADLLQVGGFDELRARTKSCGYDGALKLVQAAAVCFMRQLEEVWAAESVAWLKARAIQIAYRTTIPAMVGLAGSSALVLATLRCLCRQAGLSEHEFASAAEWPRIARDVEVVELGLAAGLQDRVLQVYGGLCGMTFSENGGLLSVERLDPQMLPALYVAYCTDFRGAGASNRVHAPLRDRYECGDPAVRRGMADLKTVAAKGALLLGGANTAEVPEEIVELERAALRTSLAVLMDDNLNLRRGMLGDEGIGKQTLAMLDVAREAGMAAKLCGSGGSIVCMPRSQEFDLFAARRVFERANYRLVPVTPTQPRDVSPEPVPPKHADAPRRAPDSGVEIDMKAPDVDQTVGHAPATHQSPGRPIRTTASPRARCPNAHPHPPARTLPYPPAHLPPHPPTHLPPHPPAYLPPHPPPHLPPRSPHTTEAPAPRTPHSTEAANPRAGRVTNTAQATRTPNRADTSPVPRRRASTGSLDTDRDSEDDARTPQSTEAADPRVGRASNTVQATRTPNRGDSSPVPKRRNSTGSLDTDRDSEDDARTPHSTEAADPRVGRVTNTAQATRTPNRTEASALKVTFNRAEAPPAQATRTPNRSETSPAQATRAPNRAEASTAQATRAPNRAEAPPAQATRTPNRAEASPAQATRTPNKAEASPAQATRPPNRAEASPAQATRTPNRAEPSPAQATRTPNRAELSPAQKRRFFELDADHEPDDDIPPAKKPSSNGI